MDCEAELGKWLQSVTLNFHGNRECARDLAQSGIRYAETNANSLTHGARQLWGLLHYWLACTYDESFKQIDDMDKAIVVSGNLDQPLELIITLWFTNNFVHFFDRRLHECRRSKEKPEALIRCFLERTRFLQNTAESNIGGRLLLCTQCCILAKIFWRYDQSFPRPRVIAEYHLQRAEILVKLGIYEAAKIDIDEVFGYGEKLRPQLYNVAAIVEINRTQTDDITLRLKRHETARRHIISGLKEFANDEQLERMMKYLDQEIKQLEEQSRPSNQTSWGSVDTESKEKSSEFSAASFSGRQPEESKDSSKPQHDDVDEAAEPKASEKKKSKKNRNKKNSSGKRKYKVKEIPRQRSNTSQPTTTSGIVNEKIKVKQSEAPKFEKITEPKFSELSMVQRKAASGGGKQKKKSKRSKESKASVALFQELSPQYSIQYGCDMCVDITIQTATVKSVAHRCLATKLLLQDRRSNSSNWIAVRPCPNNYIITEDPDDLCEHLANGEVCIEKNRCPKPHSAVEKMLWNKYFKSNLGFSRFMEDLRNTSLRVKNELARICLKYEGRYAFICGKCLKKGNTGSKKKAHIPECSEGHRWNDKRILVFEQTRGGREIVQLNQEYPSDETEEIENCLKEMLRNGFTEDEVADESIALNQRQAALVKNAGKPKKKRKQMKTEYDYTGTENRFDEYLPEDAFSGDNEYDTDLEDILTVIDSDEEYQERDTDEEREEFFAENKQERRDLYYHMTTGSDLLDLLENEPDKYKRCQIHLEGHFRAECKVLDNTSNDQIREIIIRGRVNCGPTVEGDEVVVEVKETEVLDSKKAEIEGQLKPEIEPEVDVMTTKAIRDVQVQERKRTETRGIVRGIIRKTIFRKGYMFVCQVDNYQCHLMKPLDGVAPKIHVKRKSNDSVAVFEKKEDGKLRCKKIVKLNPLKKDSMLFLVKYQFWDHSCIYPYGYVTHIIHTGETIERSQHVLNILHQVPTRPNAECEQIAKGIESAVYIENDKTLEDGRNLFVISVDPPNCRDVDDALSVEKLKDGVFRVGVHIADLTSYVEKNDAIDRNARRRTTSYYAATGKVYGMLPTCLAENVCSLAENQDRLTLSVFFRISRKGQILKEKTEIRRMIIRNRKQLTYEEAESYINKHSSKREPPIWVENDLECTICHLHYFAVKLRESRIRDGQFFYQTDDPFASDYPFESHRMIEELMLLTNRHVACFLESKYPGQFPVRVQKPPNGEDFQVWKVSHPDAFAKSFYFRQFQNLQQAFGSAFINMPASLLMPTIAELLKSATSNNLKRAKTLIGLESLHPLHHLALVQWYRIQERAEFKCSSSPSNQTATSLICISRLDIEEIEGTRRNGHFSLQLENYVQFTSPIRRFMDVIIHRFVKAALDEGPAPYTSSEVQTICDCVNKTAVLSKKYGKSCSLLKTTEKIQEPFRVPYVVEKFDDSCISVISPYLPHIKHSQRQIKFSDLLVNKNPENNGKELTLSWERRFYDAQYEKIALSIARTTHLSHETLELDSERHYAQICAKTWNLLQQAIARGNIVDLKSLIRIMVEEDKTRKQGLTKRQEITSEMKADHALVKHHVKFKQVLSRGTVLKIQVGRECLNGFLQPVNQLLQLTDDKDVCLEHRRDPIRCFAKLATESVVPSYESVEHYHSVWLPIITMEAATQTVAAGDAIYCSNVPVSLIRRNETYYGTLKLPLGFCRKRQLKIYNKEDEEDDCNDYMCIRHKIGGDRVWVAHVVSTKKEIVEKPSKHKPRDADENKMVQLGFKVQQCNGSAPDDLLKKGGHCGIEFLTKSLPDRRMEEAVKAIDSDTNLCNRIVLKRSIPDDPDIILIESDNYDLPILGPNRPEIPRNNHCQKKAIKKALSKPFTLIQGPPGTGKTVTGVKLVYWFAKANRLSHDEEVRPQILYCGPSNNAVDVAASLLKKFVGNNEVKMIRVYSEMLEKQVYPIPRDASQICHQKGRRYDMAVNADHNDIALHNLIRKPHNDHSREILKYDELFKRNIKTPEKVTDLAVEKYLRIVTQASIEELRKYDVIFCTCAASASKKMKAGTNVQQIIIDECGMCMEPESLIPLVGHPSARQVVLIGDHKQLQPIVTNTVARDLGMQKSLFERYEGRAIMLEEQYRMHPSICEFPSRMFYEEKLRTASELQKRPWSLPPIWPSRTSPCTVFIHIEGAEKTRSVSTEEGNQQSKSNEAERDEIQRIFLQLVNTHDVLPEKIAILSQYKAQCSEIEKNLKAIDISNPFVSTVVASQGGEWHYVILSLVRSLPEYEIERNPSEGWKKRNMGFIVDRHQINVALTRAKIGLIIVGNKNLLRCDEMWRELLDHYQGRGCVRRVGQFLRSFRPQIDRLTNQYAPLPEPARSGPLPYRHGPPRPGV